MYKIIDTENDSFVLEVLDEKYKFEPVLIQADIRHSGLGDFIRSLSRKLRDEYGNDFNYNEFRKEILKKSAICIYKLMKRTRVFECENQGIINGNRIDFFVYINNKLHRLTGCPSSFDLPEDCSLSCYECRFNSFKFLLSDDIIENEFKEESKKFKVRFIKDYLSNNDKKIYLDLLNKKEKIDTKRGCFINDKEIIVMCPRSIYLKDRECKYFCENSSECIKCWEEAKEDYKNGEE